MERRKLEDIPDAEFPAGILSYRDGSKQYRCSGCGWPSEIVGPRPPYSLGADVLYLDRLVCPPCHASAAGNPKAWERPGSVKAQIENSEGYWVHGDVGVDRERELDDLEAEDMDMDRDRDPHGIWSIVEQHERRKDGTL